MALTTTKIDKIKPSDKPQRLWDGGGLYLEVAPKGGRWWRWKYRFAGKEKRLGLGTYPTVGLKKARDRRDDARRMLSDGVDPSAARQHEKRVRAGEAANSFEAIGREWYAKQSTIWTASHASDVLRRLETNLFPGVGDAPIAAITAPTLLAELRKVESRGAHDLAHRMLGVAGQVFRYGVATGRCERDPSRDLRGALTPHQPQHQHAVTFDALPKLLRAIDSYDSSAIGGERQTKLALQLLALTFVRTNELIGAAWSEFDMSAREPRWTIPTSRMKTKSAHIVPLSRQALAILRELREKPGDSELVFRGRNGDKPMSNNTLLFALYRLGYRGRMTGHGFRAVASSQLNEIGFRPDVIERQLAHDEPNKVRSAYNRTEYLPERTKMMQTWADLIDHAAKDDGKVVRGKFKNSA